MRLLGFGQGKKTWLVVVALVLLLCTQALAVSEGDGGIDEVARVLLALVVVLIAAKVGGEIFVRLGQPAVLGELVFGMIAGNLYLLGYNGLEFIKTDETVHVLAEIGVVLLLFQVGLESDLGKMMKVGASSLVVATLGVVAPFALGWGVAAIFLPNENPLVHVFIGATLCATSVGITARVLMDLGRIQTAESRIILGAAVIDDVQGLVILAIVTGIIKATATGDTLSAMALGFIIFKAVAFLVGAVLIGQWLAPKVFKTAFRMKSSDILLAVALAICFGFAYLAKLLGLATIVGAFAAGIILEEIHWRNFTQRGEHSVEELTKPLVGFLAPIFFVTMGASVNLETFANVSVLGFAAVLTIAAIVGKQICSFGVLQKGLDKLSVGLGMIPRGEVGLIFAAIGSKLMLNEEPVIGDSTFSAVVIMVVVTTMITPPALKWALARGHKFHTKAEAEALAEAEEVRN